MLAKGIIKSASRLFIVLDNATPDVLEWCLVCVLLKDSVSLYPSCLQGGCFLVRICIVRTDDVCLNGSNNIFWLEYHIRKEIVNPTSQPKTHIVGSSTTSKECASNELIVLFQKWINLTHTITYIHEPFYFTSIQGSKSSDRVATSMSNILPTCWSMHNNDPSKSGVSSYSVHLDRRMYKRYDTSQKQVKTPQTSVPLKNTLYLWH